MNSEIELSAYHEAGHILLTYLTGYSCVKVVLNVDSNGNACTEQNYGDELLLIAAITNSKTDPEIFNDLSKKTKNKAPHVAYKLTSILLAGSVSECIYKNGGIIKATMTPEVSGEDLVRVDQVDYLLSMIIPDHPKTFISDNLNELFDFFSFEEFRNAAKDLAEAMLAKDNYTLNQQEIEGILNDNGFIDFIAKFQ